MVGPQFLVLVSSGSNPDASIHRVWLNLVERLLWVQEVERSNRFTRTIFF